MGVNHELKTLKAPFDGVVNRYRDVERAWLIGGESGVGKSRLVNELRIHALVQGAIVVRGNGVDGGGLPFQLWRDVLPRLILSTTIESYEASILKRLVPHISDLLGVDVPDAPPLEGKKEQETLNLYHRRYFEAPDSNCFAHFRRFTMGHGEPCPPPTSPNDS